MASELIWHRSEILGTQVITRSTGKRLGVVSELLVDVDRREVVALGLRDSAMARVLPGLSLTTYMYLDAVQQVGDVVLVEDSDVIEDIDPEEYSTLINSEVITENNDPLGRVRGFKFNLENGEVEALIIAAVGLSAVPDPLLSTYELPIEEISSTGPNRIIVFEGAEERMVQLTVGVMEKLGLGSAPWDRDDEDEYIITTTPAENQLGTGEPLRTPAYSQPYRQPAVQQQREPQRVSSWEDENWNEPEPELVPRVLPQPQEQRRRYYEADYPTNYSPEPQGRDPYGDRYDRAYEPRSPEPRSGESRYGESRYGESRPLEPRYPESRSPEPRYGESRPGESRSGESRSAEPRYDDRGRDRYSPPGTAPNAPARNLPNADPGYAPPYDRPPEPPRREPSRPVPTAYREAAPSAPSVPSPPAAPPARSPEPDTSYNNYFDDEDVWADTPSSTPYSAPLTLPEK